MINKRQPNLLKVVGAVGSIGSFARHLHRREQQSCQNAYDGDDDKQFNERKAGAFHDRTPEKNAPLHAASYATRAETCKRHCRQVVVQFDLENLEAAVAIFMAYYNFVWRTRKPVGGRCRVPAAMAAGVVKELWKFDDLYEQAPPELTGLFAIRAKPPWLLAERVLSD